MVWWETRVKVNLNQVWSSIVYDLGETIDSTSPNWEKFTIQYSTTSPRQCDKIRNRHKRYEIWKEVTKLSLLADKWLYT